MVPTMVACLLINSTHAHSVNYSAPIIARRRTVPGRKKIQSRLGSPWQLQNQNKDTLRPTTISIQNSMAAWPLFTACPIGRSKPAKCLTP
uniref:Putative secreted protein n=1 Tax=Anopheles triannulatus TaxID=58253 RepID=A0A2M4B5W1_9DIPT